MCASQRGSSVQRPRKRTLTFHDLLQGRSFFRFPLQRDVGAFRHVPGEGVRTTELDDFFSCSSLFSGSVLTPTLEGCLPEHLASHDFPLQSSHDLANTSPMLFTSPNAPLRGTRISCCSSTVAIDLRTRREASSSWSRTTPIMSSNTAFVMPFLLLNVLAPVCSCTYMVLHRGHPVPHFASSASRSNVVASETASSGDIST